MPTGRIGKGLKDKIRGLTPADQSRYRLVLYGIANALDATNSTVYDPIQEIPSSANYTNTGVAATTGYSVAPAVSASGFTVANRIVTTATGETIGPVYYAVIVDGTDGTILHYTDYADAPKTASNGGSFDLSPSGTLISYGF